MYFYYTIIDPLITIAEISIQTLVMLKGYTTTILSRELGVPVTDCVNNDKLPHRCTHVPCFVDERISTFKKCQQLSTNIYHCLSDELYETCRDGDGEGERKPKTIYYAGQIFQANCKIFRAKLSFIGQGKTEKRFHLNNFKYYEVCAQTAQGQR